jgi:hypothetical protein
VKKLAILVTLVAIAGCRRQTLPSPSPANIPGAATPREAVTKFMSAARTQNIQAMADVWGDARGPVRETMEREQLEQREVVLIGCLKHDSYRVLGEAPAAGGERVLAVEVKLRDLTRSTNFYAIRGPSERWYVRTFDLESVKDICVRKA